MFWSGNYIAVRELNFLLKEENVTLAQVLEADDILQECKADNKGLIQFLTKPDVLAELITLITEEPPKDVELASQYRHASIACEVLTSHLSMLSDRLSLDSVQMNRLCDFINKEPPLNPLLASYFSKTIEMLLERSPKQDWYLYHIVCLRVLDFLKSRRDFLPNLLRHLATSAIADTFKCFIRLDDLFNKIVMEWLEEHQFLESLIQIICGTYVPEPLRSPADVTPPPPAAAASAPAPAPPASDVTADQPEKAEQELNEKPEVNHKEEGGGRGEEGTESTPPDPKSTEDAVQLTTRLVSTYRDKVRRAEAEAQAEAAAARSRGVAAANAAGLLCDLILNGCAGETCTTRLRTVWVLVSRLQSEEWVRGLLGSMFTSPAASRQHAIVHGCQVLLALLSTDPILAGVCAGERTSVELAVAPHLPLLHQALLRDPDDPDDEHPNHHEGGAGAGAGAGRRVGWARLQVAALLAQLALSSVEDVPTTMLTLGTPGTLVELQFRHRDNNFLHAQVYAFLKHALANRAYRTQYASHLFVECDLLTRLMDAFEENENKNSGCPRAGYMGHVVLALRRAWAALQEAEGELAHALRLPAPLAQRFADFYANKLKPVLQQHETPLGGYYPSDNIYEFNDMVGGNLDELGDDMDINAVPEMCVEGEGGEAREGDDTTAGQEKASNSESAFLDLASRRFDDDMWEDTPDFEQELGAAGQLTTFTAWESGAEAEGAEGAEAGSDWAQFERAAPPPPPDPFAHTHINRQFTAYWFSDAAESSQQQNLEESMKNLSLSGEPEPAPEQPLPHPPAAHTDTHTPDSSPDQPTGGAHTGDSDSAAKLNDSDNLDKSDNVDNSDKSDKTDVVNANAPSETAADSNSGLLSNATHQHSI